VSSSRLKLLIAYAAIYLLWGASYLFISFAVETLPPLLMVAVRFGIAGVIISLIARYGRSFRQPQISLRKIFIAAGLQLVGGSALLAWSQQWVPSGMASLLISTVPLWLMIFEWLNPAAAQRPRTREIIGLLIGFAGIAFLINPATFTDDVPPLFSLLVLVSAILWAFGSLYARDTSTPQTLLSFVGVQMLCASLMLLILGAAAGEFSQIDPATMTSRSLIGLGGLIAIDSIAFTAYAYLLQRQPVARVATYAYINPVIALILGVLLANEAFGAGAALSTACILGAVMLVNTARGAESE
jgi:drug/metabolite transporter (DMT)-like permease